MSVKLLIVDDSAVVRGLVSKTLSEHSEFKVAGTAANGQVAIEMAASLQPDIVILDIQMPVMDGLTALPEILKAAPKCKVLIASTLTPQNAPLAFKALELGAADYIGKPSAHLSEGAHPFFEELLRKLRGLANIKEEISGVPKLKVQAHFQPVKALAVIASTGGPQALATVLSPMREQLKYIPVFITQHMPPHFTRLLAENLQRNTGHNCAEAIDGEIVRSGHIYIAPGDYHMKVVRAANGEITIKLGQESPENYCRPSADPMLRSLAEVYGVNLLTVVLTGMGHDGLLGCAQVVEQGGRVIAQDEASCVVYGMPRVVSEQGLCSAVLPLAQISQYLIAQIGGRL